MHRYIDQFLLQCELPKFELEFLLCLWERPDSWNRLRRCPFLKIWQQDRDCLTDERVRIITQHFISKTTSQFGIIQHDRRNWVIHTSDGETSFGHCRSKAFCIALNLSGQLTWIEQHVNDLKLPFTSNNVVLTVSKNFPTFIPVPTTAGGNEFENR